VDVLHVASKNGPVEMLEELIALGADKEAQGPDGWRPLHMAAFSGHVDVLRALCALGADMEAQKDDRGRPLHLATG
jgi:ankyrin repeat protein